MLAATSHAFWLGFLTPARWKAMRMAVYAACAAVVLHVALGRLQADGNPLLVALAGGSGLALATRHLLAGRR